MKETIVKLSNKLRKDGMAVSIRTTQTAMDTYALLGNNDRTQLKDALRSVYVKNKYDIPKFDDAFESFFVKSLREPKNPQTIHSLSSL